MAQTFKDFVVECEMYPYSKENFEIMKECEEISLLSKMLENHYVLQELALDSVQFESTSYMTEYTQPIEVIEESVKDKIKAVFTTIKKKLVWLLERLASFIQKRADSVKKTIISDDMIAQMKNLPASEQQKLISKYDSFKGNLGFKFKVGKATPEEKKPKTSIFKTIKALTSAQNALNEAAGDNTEWKELVTTCEGIFASQKSDGNTVIDLEYNTPTTLSLDNFLWYIEGVAAEISKLTTTDISSEKNANKCVNNLQTWADIDPCKYNHYEWRGDASKYRAGKNSYYSRIEVAKEVIITSHDRLMKFADTIDTSGEWQSKYINAIQRVLSTVMKAGAITMKAEADGGKFAAGMRSLFNELPHTSDGSAYVHNPKESK